MKVLALFLVSGFLFSVTTPVHGQNCNLPGSDLEKLACELLDRMHSDLSHVQDTASFAESEALENSDKIKSLELRLSTLEARLQMAEETIQRLHWESSLQMRRRPARAAARKPKAPANKAKPTVHSKKDQ